MLTVFLIMQAGLTGCSLVNGRSSETDDGRSDACDAEWFDVTLIDIASEYDVCSSSPYTFASYNVLTYDPEDETVLLLIGGETVVEPDKPRDMENLCPFLHLNRYRFDGTLVERADISSIDPYFSEDGTGGYTPKVMMEDDRDNDTVTFLVEQMDWSDYTYKYVYMNVDMTSGDYYISNELNELNSLIHAGESVIRSVRIGDKCMFIYGRYDYGSDYQANLSSLGIVLLDSDGSVEEVDRSVFPPIHEIRDISGVYAVNDGQMLLMFDTASEGKDYLYDVSTGETCEIGISEDIRSGIGRSMGNLLPNIAGVVDEKGFTAWDPDRNEFRRMIEIDKCNVNDAEFNYCLPVTVSEDQIVLGTSFVNWGKKGGIRLYVFEQTDTNPHDSKTVLTIAPIGGLQIMGEWLFTGDVTYELYEAIYRFNEMSGEYYIEVDDSYLFENDSEFGRVIPPIDDETLTVAYEAIDRLAVDLQNGDGPDMILGPMDRSFMDDENYLMDMMPFIDSGTIETDGLFENAIYGRMNRDHLYTVPLDILINCISVDSRIKPVGTIGLTFEEYTDMVKNDLNGYDTVLEKTYGSQMNYFLAFFEALFDDFVHDGQVDLDNDEFRQLCGFVHDSYMEIMSSGTDRDEYIMESEGYMRCFYSRCGQFGMFYETWSEAVPVMSYLGMPSPDGRGVTLSSDNVIAIAAHTDHYEGCLEFIKFALSDEIQELFGTRSINRSIFEDSATTMINTGNEERLYRSDDSGLPLIQFDAEELIRSFETSVDNAHGILGSDPAIRIILIEELPAYFEGARSLDDIIPIIEDRCQTVLDERG